MIPSEEKADEITVVRSVRVAERGIPVIRKMSRLTAETGGEDVGVLAGDVIGGRPWGAGDGVRLGERLKGAMNLRKRDEDIGRED